MAKVKVCKVCGRSNVPFYPNRAKCKTCYKKHVQETYAATEEGIAARRKARDKYNKTEKGRLQAEIYYKSNPQAREAKIIRSGCLAYIRGTGALVKFTKYVGCTREEFKAHLEAQFTPSMTWDNYGKYWHIDHIKQLGHFDLTKLLQFREACHFSNTRPLPKLDNFKRPRKKESEPEFHLVELRPRHLEITKSVFDAYVANDFALEDEDED